MTGEATAKARAAWNRYWSAGRPAACAAGADGQYFPVVRRFWRRLFARSPDDAVILDMATGNGAVLSVAAEVAAERKARFSLIGVDHAEIQATVLQAQTERLGLPLTLHSTTPCEDLPLADDSVDTVTAQYALEYTDLERSLDEVERVLRPEGQLAAVMHTQGSGVMDQTRRDLSDLDLVEREAGVVDAFEALVAAEIDGDRFSDEQRQSDEWRAARQRFEMGSQRVLAELRSRPPAQAQFLSLLLTSMGELYQHRRAHPVGEVRARLADLRTEVEAHRERLEQMSAAALSPEAVRATANELKARGFEVDSAGPLIDDKEHEYGWAVVARRTT